MCMLSSQGCGNLTAWGNGTGSSSQQMEGHLCFTHNAGAGLADLRESGVKFSDQTLDEDAHVSILCPPTPFLAPTKFFFQSSKGQVGLLASKTSGWPLEI